MYTKPLKLSGTLTLLEIETRYGLDRFGLKYLIHTHLTPYRLSKP